MLKHALQKVSGVAQIVHFPWVKSARRLHNTVYQTSNLAIKVREEYTIVADLNDEEKSQNFGTRLGKIDDFCCSKSMRSTCHFNPFPLCTENIYFCHL